MEQNKVYVPLNQTDFEVIKRQSSFTSYQKDLRKSFHLPRKLKRTFCCVISLLVLGLIMFIIGILKVSYQESLNEGIPFFVIGVIVLIPGVFYTYQFFKARFIADVDDRHEILSDIPQL